MTHRMATITEETENLFRIFKLVSGLATEAVREKFDLFFPPITLSSIIKREELRLRYYYRRGWLNALQISLLFPTSGSISSATFDLTLMVCLLKTITTLQPPESGYDCLPHTSEICDGADLARVKYYRNQIAYSEIDTFTTQDFTRIWLDLTGAITRLGGNQYKAQFDDQFQQNLDMGEKLELMRMLQAFKAEVVGENNEIKQKTEEFGCYDFHQHEIDEWLKEHTRFVTTNAVDFVLRAIHENKRIVVTGIPGIGKSALIRHVALILCIEQGYNIIPCNSPSDIKTHFKEDRFQIFVFDDVCGRYDLNQNDVEEWKQLQKSILGLLTKGNSIIISSCRLQIFKECRFQNITLLSDFCCDLSSERFELTNQQRLDIAYHYMPKEKVHEIEDCLQNCEMLPLICSRLENKPSITVFDFWTYLFEIYTMELDQLLLEGSDKIYALFLLVVDNGCVKKDWLVSEGTQRLTVMLNACGINKEASRIDVLQQFDALVDTYLKMTESHYKAYHDKLFEFLCCYFGQRMQAGLIKYADRKVIYERMLLCKKDEFDTEFAVLITEENELAYCQRIYKDISDGFICDLLYSNSIKLEKFRNIIINYFKTQTKEIMMKLIKTRNQYGDTSLQIASCLGYTDIVECMISFIDNINAVLVDEFPPLHQACFQGHDKIVKLFLDKNANLNSVGFNGWSPLMWACEGRHHSIVYLLVEKGVSVNDFITGGRTLLTEWCLLGNEEIVDLLILNGAKVNLIDGNGETPLTSACSKGHENVVLLLINKGVDVNTVNVNNETPLMLACSVGNIRIAQLLIDKGVNVNMSDIHGDTALIRAVRYEAETFKTTLDEGINNKKQEEQFPIVNTLLRNKACINQLNYNGDSPLRIANNLNCVELLTILIDYDALEQDRQNVTNLIVAIQQWQSKSNNRWRQIFTDLLDKGADINLVDSNGNTVLGLAAYYGLLDAVNMIVNICYEKEIHNCVEGTYMVDKANTDGKTPLMLAIEFNLNCFRLDRGFLQPIWSFPSVNTVHPHIAKKLKEKIQGKYNLMIMNALLDSGAMINAHDNEGNTVLGLAIKSRLKDAAIMLVDEGGGIDTVNNEGKTPYMLAVESKLELIKVLLDRGAETNAADNDGNTILDLAFQSRMINVVMLIIDRGVDVNKVNKDGKTPLILAVERKIMAQSFGYDYNFIDSKYKHPYTEIIKVLLNRGADINAIDNKGNTAWEIAVQSVSKDVVTMLLDGGADINTANKVGRNPLMLAVTLEPMPGSYIYYSEKQKIKIIEVLLDRGAETTTADNDGNTVLELALKSRLTEVVKMLFNKGIDINKVNREGKTPLMIAVDVIFKTGLYRDEMDYVACEYNPSYAKLIKDFLDRGAQINASDNKGNKALGLAIQSRIKDVVMILIDGGADINTSNKDGKTPLMLAVEIKRMPLSHRYHFEQWWIDIIKALLNRGAETNADDNDGNTVLGLAIKSRLTDVVILLLDKGADINKVNKDGKTPLMLAAECKLKPVSDTNNRFLTHASRKKPHTKIIEVLLDRGAKSNAVDYDGNTVLELALKSQFTDGVMLLIDGGADINKANKAKKTPLMLAVESEITPGLYTDDKNYTTILLKVSSTEIINVLLDKGADINAADTNGDTVLGLAVRSRYEDAVVILLDRGAKMKV